MTLHPPPPPNLSTSNPIPTSGCRQGDQPPCKARSQLSRQPGRGLNKPSPHVSPRDETDVVTHLGGDHLRPLGVNQASRVHLVAEKYGGDQDEELIEEIFG
jgi:hypothetical protein